MGVGTRGVKARCRRQIDVSRLATAMSRLGHEGGGDEEPAAVTATLLTANISMSTDLSRGLDPPSSYIQQRLW